MSDTTASLESLGLLLQVSDVQDWLNLDGDEPEAWLEAAVQAGNASVLDWLGWDPRQQTYTETVDGRGTCSIVVKHAPITAITAVNFLCQGNAVPQNILMFNGAQDAPLIYSQCRFPRAPMSVQVTYQAGYPNVPGAILQGLRYTIKAMLQAAGVDFNATGESYSGVLSQTFWAQGPGVVPPAAQTLMQKYQRTM